MRRNSVRHFIHAVIDVIPLLVIPIFALNILHKEVEPISLTTSGYEVRSKYETNEVNTSSDIVIGNVYHCDDLYFDKEALVNDGIYIRIEILNCVEIALFDYSDYELFEINNNEYNANNVNYLKINAGDSCHLFYTNNSLNADVCLYDYDLEFVNVDFIVYSNVTDFRDYIDDNGISVEESNFEVLEYVYNEGIVLDNTDIGSQFIYSLYIPVHDYFNFNNLFNMGSIYNWIQLNLFQGTAPLPVFIIWNIIVYEFFVDLIFLFYSVFMFVIDFATNCLDTFTRKGRKGV